MEDVLDLYEEPYDAKRPKVCFDETSKQLVIPISVDDTIKSLDVVWG